MTISLSFDQIILQCNLAAGPFEPEDRLCDWCGGRLEGRRRRWCSDSCGRLAAQNHYFRQGRVRALRRDSFTCQACGKRGTGMQVNHIIPCLGKHSLGGCWHHLDNLETLCKPCHQAETKRQRDHGEI